MFFNKGNIQADLVGKFLKELALKFSFMKIISSKKLRAIQTGSNLAKYFPELEFENDSILNELNKNSINEENDQFKEAFRKYFHNEPRKKNNESLILVCHANIIRAFTCK
jgi:broad specificity phosphatase PhoE